MFLTRSDVTLTKLEGLVTSGLLRPLTQKQEWGVPCGERIPVPPRGYVVSFVAFHERGFTTPAHRFFRGLLHHYGVELQHLNPNGIQHIACFIALYEGYLGIRPSFELWKYFFNVALINSKTHGKVSVHHPIGCAGIQLRSGGDRRTTTWPPFIARLIKEVPKVWGYGPVDEDKRKIANQLEAILNLRAAGLTGSGVVAAYHKRRVAPIMARCLMLCQMVSDANLTGTTLAEEEPSAAVIMKRVKDAFETPSPYPDPQQPEEFDDTIIAEEAGDEEEEEEENVEPPQGFVLVRHQEATGGGGSPRLGGGGPKGESSRRGSVEFADSPRDADQSTRDVARSGSPLPHSSHDAGSESGRRSRTPNRLPALLASGRGTEGAVTHPMVDLPALEIGATNAGDTADTAIPDVIVVEDDVDITPPFLVGPGTGSSVKAANGSPVVMDVQEREPAVSTVLQAVDATPQSPAPAEAKMREAATAAGPAPEQFVEETLGSPATPAQIDEQTVGEPPKSPLMVVTEELESTPAAESQPRPDAGMAPQSPTAMMVEEGVNAEDPPLVEVEMPSSATPMMTTAPSPTASTGPPVTAKVVHGGLTAAATSVPSLSEPQVAVMASAVVTSMVAVASPSGTRAQSADNTQTEAPAGMPVGGNADILPLASPTGSGTDSVQSGRSSGQVSRPWVFQCREIDWGRLNKVSVDHMKAMAVHAKATTEHAKMLSDQAKMVRFILGPVLVVSSRPSPLWLRFLFGPRFSPLPKLPLQEMQLRDGERLRLQARERELLEENRKAREDPASALRALEDERWARAADHNMTNQTLNDVLAQSALLREEREAAVRERDAAVQGPGVAVQSRDLVIAEHDTATAERDTAVVVQERNAAVRDRDTAIQDRDATLQEWAVALNTVEEAQEREKKEAETTVASMAVVVAQLRASQQRAEATTEEVRRLAESKVQKAKEMLELEASRLETLRHAPELVASTFGEDPDGNPQRLGAQLLRIVEGVHAELQAARNDAETARQGADAARRDADIARQGTKAARREGTFLVAQRAFAVARSRYIDITLDELSQGYPTDYTEEELEAFEEEVAPFSQTLADRMQAERDEHSSPTTT
ncbi:hypothetical protein PVAP13_9KG175926 [Panicum virgatum]|uniref:Transposase (putative) gypsy type domain-containing protein n=1 Tax=Panicum virgatum TaxID=38727 RepID=A0A8T0NIM1_PANVG|nr:hypothetical protein PVAP13_9KG175926 [Panicum virgatum]